MPSNDHGEPTVWDWVKSMLRFRPIPIPERDVSTEPSPTETRRESAPSLDIREVLSWDITLTHLRFPAALLLALVGQSGLTRGTWPTWVGGALLIIGGAVGGWALWMGDFEIRHQSEEAAASKEAEVRLPFLAGGLVLAYVAFLGSGGNRFSLPLLMVWAGSLTFILLAFWEGDLRLRERIQSILGWFRRPTLTIQLGPWEYLVIGVIFLVAFIRVVDLQRVPYEMWSDHAEKLLDVVDVLNGQSPIYFPRNTGREAMQFYLAAATAKWLGTGISFLTLKIGTVMAGLLTLPPLYLFAREYGGRTVGLAAVGLAGVAYWPNVISRIGLRFPLYPLFTAPALYFVLKGLRLKRRNDFLLAGLAMGVGLHGYSPARVIPLAACLAVAVFLLHSAARGFRFRSVGWLITAGLVALVLFVPLLRVAISMPDLFMQRILTRVAETEQAIQGSPLIIFLKNAWDGLLMFNWNAGEIWVVTIPDRPLLDWVTGGMFILGMGIALARYVKTRRWQDLFLILVIPVLMLPSTLALAFPNENPAPNRASGAMVPVFTLAGLAFTGIYQWALSQWRGGRGRYFGYSILVLLAILIVARNYSLAMSTYADRVRDGSWNTSEAGEVIRHYAESVGDYDRARVVAFPHWMDTRLVGIHAGIPTRDYAIWPDQIYELPEQDRTWLFLLNSNDEEGLNTLHQVFPRGRELLYRSKWPNKDFLIYFAPSIRSTGTEAAVP